MDYSVNVDLVSKKIGKWLGIICCRLIGIWSRLWNNTDRIYNGRRRI